MISRILFKVASIACLALTVGLLAGGEPKAAPGFAVEFRLPQAKSAHFDDEAQAERFRQTMQRLGCEVRTQRHGDHLDVAYRCPKWRILDVASDAEAHRWDAWLKAKGFETAHQH